MDTVWGMPIYRNVYVNRKSLGLGCSVVHTFIDIQHRKLQNLTTSAIKLPSGLLDGKGKMENQTHYMPRQALRVPAG
jgi:hypothetical protein